MAFNCRFYGYSRPGQSGSPVIVYKKDMNNHVITGLNPSNTRGTLVIGSKDFNINLLGIYSGRIHKESNIGMVWKTSAIKELIDSIQSATKIAYCPYPKINIKF